MIGGRVGMCVLVKMTLYRVKTVWLNCFIVLQDSHHDYVQDSLDDSIDHDYLQDSLDNLIDHDYVPSSESDPSTDGDMDDGSWRDMKVLVSGSFFQTLYWNFNQILLFLCENTGFFCGFFFCCWVMQGNWIVLVGYQLFPVSFYWKTWGIYILALWQSTLPFLWPSWSLCTR